MICRDSSYRLWLRQECGLSTIDNEDDAVEALYRICNIKSRTELNGNKEAQDKFDEMVEDYERWKEESKPF